MRRPARGFTLMETLVMLIVSALAVSLMFQALASFNRSRERIGAIEGVRNNQTVLAGWIADSMSGLIAFDPATLPVSQAGDPELGLHGDGQGFTATTTSPLLGEAGVPTVIHWQVEPAARGATLVYQETGHAPLRFALDSTLAFSYVDAKGKTQDQWPPQLGRQDALPATVELRLGQGPGARVIAASSADPRPQPLPAYGPEVDQ